MQHRAVQVVRKLCFTEKKKKKGKQPDLVPLEHARIGSADRRADLRRVRALLVARRGHMLDRARDAPGLLGPDGLGAGGAELLRTLRVGAHALGTRRHRALLGVGHHAAGGEVRLD